MKDSNNALGVLQYYDYFGLSVNTKEELELIKGYYNNHAVVITNFNIINLFLYEEIEEYVKKNDLSWMIQFTMYPDEENELALYNNDKALEEFVKKVQNSLNKKIKIVMADNITTYDCSAGTKSIGILSNGDVVPCLSMRSWVPDMSAIIQGNVLAEPMKDMWENKFRDYRFKEFKCCKDQCKNKTVSDKVCTPAQNYEINLNLDDYSIFPKSPITRNPSPMTSPTAPVVMLYGVTPYNEDTMKYGEVKNPMKSITCAYLVRTSGPGDANWTEGTSTCFNGKDNES